ncbi:hypothetical protein BaRGS_00040286, partial [Batillaria attramentaria]
MYVLCETTSVIDTHPPDIHLNAPSPSAAETRVQLIRCPTNHTTQVFFACDASSACWSGDERHSRSCDAPLTPLPPSFKCSDGSHVPYTLVCDHRRDCGDGSDESFCHFPNCLAFLERQCDNRQCIRTGGWCDWQAHCADGSDEKNCPYTWTPQLTDNIHVYPAIISFNGTDLARNEKLVYLNISDCALVNLTSPRFPNLVELDLSDNRLWNINETVLIYLKNLRVLYLAGNPLTSFLRGASNQTKVMSLLSLNLARVPMTVLNPVVFDVFPNLQELNFSGSGLQQLPSSGFQSLKGLRVLDIRNCPIGTTPQNAFRGLDSLE